MDWREKKKKQKEDYQKKIAALRAKKGNNEV